MTNANLQIRLEANDTPDTSHDYLGGLTGLWLRCEDSGETAAVNSIEPSEQRAGIIGR